MTVINRRASWEPGMNLTPAVCLRVFAARAIPNVSAKKRLFAETFTLPANGKSCSGGLPTFAQLRPLTTTLAHHCPLIDSKKMASKTTLITTATVPRTDLPAHQLTPSPSHSPLSLWPSSRYVAPPVTKPLVIAGRQIRSRLFVGTGKFSSPQLMRDALEASGAEIVTVALRRADLSGKGDPFANILDFVDPKRFLVLPNTSGAMNADEAVRLAKLARVAGLPNWVKLEIHPDPRYLLPDPVETFKAAEILVKEGFVVLPYINADPVLAKRLQDVGTATVMPLGSPIGSNRGLETREQLRIIIEQATVPVVIDAGIGAPSHAAEAMELGADAVLVNTAIAIANDPCRMARAFATGVQCDRDAFESGLPGAQLTAAPTSPLTAFLQ